MKRFLTITTIVLFVLVGAGSIKAQNSRFHKKGYSGNAELGILAKEYPYGTISTTHGYNFGNGWFIGGGASFQSGLYPRVFDVEREPVINPDGSFVESHSPKEQYEGGFLLGAHFAARYAFMNRKFTPYLDIKTGVTYDLAIESLGSFIQPSAGVLYGRFSLSAGLNTHFGQKQSGCLIRPDVKFMPHIGLAVHF